MRSHARTCDCTHVRAHTQSQTVLANARKRKRTQINARKRSLRLTRGRFLRSNTIAFCALDLKLSGCTISIKYIRYVCKGEVKTSFIRVLELPDGTAHTITEAVCGFCRDLALEMQHLCGLGSDGAAVMLGIRGGVSKLLKDQVPFLVANHCIAHRLALAAGQAANEITYPKRFKAVLDQLYRFYENFPVRSAGLKSTQQVLNDPCLKLTQAKDVRWLSHDKAVSNLRRCLPSVITSLEREAEKRYNAEASGLAAFVKTYKFVSALYMFCDVLPPLAGLSRAFQKHDIDFTVVKPLVAGTKSALMLFSLFQETASAACPKCFQSLKSLVYSSPLIIKYSNSNSMYMTNI